jgi:N-methylhydantoinase A/oxoprolinase/acetone carboxylase beta subunit
MIIGLDVGGTHTDVVLLGQEGILRQVKVPTDRTNLLESVTSALEQIAEGYAHSDIRRMVLSTTLTTNAIAAETLPPVGLIVSSGPGVDPEHFRIGDHYHPVAGSIDHRGREILPIDRSEVERAGEALKQAGVGLVGIVGKFSTRNPKHENEIREILGSEFSHLVMGHHLSGNLNFPRRISTAYLNAAVYPGHKLFFEAVGDSLKKKGMDIPIYILKADGGTMSFDASLDHPQESIFSGPAASVMGSLPFAPEGDDVLVLDIGGTTTDMAVLVDRSPLLDMAGIEIGDHKTLIRSLKTRSIGVGGDSAVRVAGGRLEVGPDRQGPAMAYGGSVPTPTDALFVLGHNTQGDVAAARRGMEDIASQIGVDTETAAQRVFDMACIDILDAAHEMVLDINRKPVYTIHELLEGYQVVPTNILVLGGPAPHFAIRLCELTEYQCRAVPRSGVANAIGAGLARTTCQVTLFADTERGLVNAPEEEYFDKIEEKFGKKEATVIAFELLHKKAVEEGADPTAKLDMELVEEQEFNMVRGFRTTGKNIRVKVQIKPGLIKRYGPIAEKLRLEES